MVQKFKFSLVASAVRYKWYKRVHYELMRKHDIPFEVVFAGFKPPDEEMYPNFKYIYTEEKPAHALERAVRASVGEYVIPICDDYIFQKAVLAKFDYYLSRLFMENAVVGSRYKNGEKFKDNWLLFDRTIKNAH